MINLEDYKMTNSSGVGVYVGTYKKYNEGSLFGMWIDLEAVSDADNIEDVRERCMGQFDTFQDFSDQCADEELACMNAPEFCTRYFDYEAYARDLKYEFSVSDNGYIFRDK